MTNQSIFNVTFQKISKITSAFLLAFLLVVTTPTSSFAQEVQLELQPTENQEETQEIVPQDTSENNAQNEEISEQEESIENPEKALEEKELSKGDGMEAMALGMSVSGAPGIDNRVAGEASLPNTDQSTGALSYKFPIVVPPGRLNMTPDVALMYNSQDKKSEILGLGWSINIPYIERLNKKGSDTMYSENYFTSSLNGELFNISGGDYSAKVENGDFIKYQLASNVWTVTDKNGVVYKYGTSAASRQDNPSDSSKVFRWMLEEVRDTNNNVITYQYYKDAGQIYPSKIIYTGTGSTAGIFSVNFDRVSRTGIATQYSHGFGVTTNYGISEIRTEESGTWLRKYTLAYGASDNGQSLLLDTIIESGRDESAAVTTLPAVDFDYTVSTPGWTRVTSGDWLPDQYFLDGTNDRGVRMADINGDGLVDILCHNDNSNSPVNAYCKKAQPKIWLNTGSGWALSSTWTFPVRSNGRVEAFTDSSYQDTGLRLVDVNGDGLVDMTISKDPNEFTYLNNGVNGWDLVPSYGWLSPYYFLDGSNDVGMRMADINGDGLVDILCHNENGNSPTSAPCKKTQPRIWLNNGSGWTLSSTWTFPANAASPGKLEAFTDSSYRDTGLRLVDVNGDGLADLIRGQDPSNYHTYINNGLNGWTLVSPTTFTHPYYFLRDGEIGMRMGDINGDGLIDMLCHNTDGTNSRWCSKNDPKIWINNGTGWTGVTSPWLFPINPSSVYESFTRQSGGNFYDDGLRIIDIDGDGIPDFMKSKDPSVYTYLSNTKLESNLLKKITYSQGGNTEISYKPVAQIRASGTLLNPNLPATMNVVSQIKNNDSAISETYTYSYEGGKYYFGTYLDRKFAGFSKVTETDSAGNIKNTYYHQGDTTNTAGGEYSDEVSKIGKIYRIEEYNNNGNLYRLTVNKWDKYNIATGHDFTKLVRQTVLTYEGDSSHADTSTEYTYDNTNGNVLTKTEYGKVIASTDGSYTDTSSDTKISTYTYAVNGTNGVNVPSSVTVTNSSAAKVSEQKYYYDALSLGSVGNGNKTKIEQWKDSTNYINTQKTYNSYGLALTATDPRGKVTSYSYDSNNLYPATVTDPLSHTTQYVYDYSLGKPKQTTDQNGFVYQTVFDGLDRVITEKIPDLTTPSTLVNKTEYVYTDTSGSVRIKRTDNLDGSNGVDTYQYFDGLGRKIQERVESESDYNVKDTAYSNRGMLLKESLPYSSSGSSKTSPTGTTSLYTSYTHDALGRPLTVITGAGTTTYVYDDWKTTVTDAEGNVKSYYNNAYGNLIKVEEINNSSTYTTNYEWDLNNKLTKIIDALGNIRNFTYDGLGRKLTAEDLHAISDGTFGTWTYVYDDAGNVTQTVDPKTQIINYTFNDVNQPLTEDYTGAVGTEITYTYGGCTNGTGKLCSAVMTTGANTSYTYNSNGSIATETKTINGVGYTTSYAYNRKGNVITVTYPDASDVKYTFNAGGMIEKVERKEGGGSYVDVVSNFDYNPMGLVATQVDANTTTTTNTYDASKLYRLTRKLTQNTVPTKLQDLNYTYDKVGNITQIIDSANTDGAKTAVYVYDDLNRLTSATITSVPLGQTAYTQNYTYDAIGNITSGPLGTYVYDGNTGVLTANPHAVTGIGAVTYAYDANGNLIGDGTITNTWNYKNQIAQTVKTPTTVTYKYDHDGNRMVYDNGTLTTVYPNKYYNTDGTKQVKQIYAGDSLVATVETIATVVSPYYVHVDHLNSTNSVSDGTGAIVETLDYYPYGANRISSGAHTEQRQYIGQLHDVDTGLEYLNARYYKSDLGRFVSQDPMFWNISEKVLKDPQSLNSYSYSNNNPITISDPSGKCFWDACIGEALLVMSVAETVSALITTAYVVDYVGTQLNPNISSAAKKEYANQMAIDAGAVISGGIGATGLSRLESSAISAESKGVNKALTLQANRSAGAAFEATKMKEVSKAFPNAQPQVTMKTPSGIVTRMDIVSRDSFGNMCLFECKSSWTAPLTKNQSLAFPEIKQFGATILGQGKPGFPGGTIIPPTKVNILRP